MFNIYRTADFEKKLRLLEDRIGILEYKIKKLEEEKDNQSSEINLKKTTGNREEHIQSVMRKTGWNHEVASAAMKAAREKTGITYRDYDLYDFHQASIDSQEAEYQKILKSKKRKKERQQARELKYLERIMEETGWEEDYARGKIERAKKVAGSSYDHYSMYRFWELSEEEQKTYFTKRDAVALRRKYNIDKEAIKILKTKDECCKKMEEFLGRPWMSTENMQFSEFKEKFEHEKKIVYKPKASSGGKGIKIFDIQGNNLENLFKKISESAPGVIEGFLIQHSEMKKLSSNSVNTIRIVTILSKRTYPNVEKDKMYYVYAGLRMGKGNTFVDNLHSGGMIAAVNIDTGIVETAGVDHNSHIYFEHPDTGNAIKGFQIPYFKEAKELIAKAGSDIPGCLGWDVAITENGPVIVEVNTSPGADGLQVPYVLERKGMRHVIEKYL